MCFAVCAQRKSGSNLDSDRALKKQETECAAASTAAASDTVIVCDSGYPLGLSQQLHIWDGQEDVLPQNEVPRGRSSMEFHDVYGSTLSPKRQNETLGQRSVSGDLSLNLPGVVSETPYYYRKQKQQQMQQQRYSKQQPAAPEDNLQADACYIKGSKSAAQIESEVDYELDQADESWLDALNRAGKEQCGKDWGMFLEDDMEVLIDRYEKADATLHKLAGHSAVRTEVLLHERPAVPDVRGVSTMVQHQVHEWWMAKRHEHGEQLLRRFRAPPDEDDEDDAKAFRRVSIGSRMASPLQGTGSRNGAASETEVARTEHQVGDMVEANFHGRGKYFGGIIAAVNPNGSFAVKYHDGDSENEVPAVFIRKMTSRRHRASAPQQGPTGTACTDAVVAVTAETGTSAVASDTASSRANAAVAVEQQTPSACHDKSACATVAASAETMVQSQPRLQSQLPPSPKSAGDIVEANYHGLGKFYTGTVAAVNQNGTYRVQYHDGDCEDEVPAFDVRRLTARRRRNPQQPPVAPPAPTAPTGPAQSDTVVPSLPTVCTSESLPEPVKTEKPKAVKPPVPAQDKMAASDMKEKDNKENVKPKPTAKAKAKVNRKARQSADALLISKEQAFSLRSGDRVMFQWDEPEDKDHGVWFAATITSDGTSRGWFEMEFDTFSVENTSSWNLPYHASKGRLRRATTTAASRIRRGAGGPVLEWSRSMGGSVLPAEQVTPRRPSSSSGKSNQTASTAAGQEAATQHGPSDSATELSPAEGERRRQQAAELDALKAGPPLSPKAVGDIVEANYHGRGKWYAGTVAAVDTGSGYRIEYHDGDSEDNVPAWYVKRMTTRSRRTRIAAAPYTRTSSQESTDAPGSNSAGAPAPYGDSEPTAKRAKKHHHQQEQLPQQQHPQQDGGSDGSLWQTLWSELVKVGWHQSTNPFRQQQQDSASAAAADEHGVLYFAPTTGARGDNTSKAGRAGAVLDSKAAVFRFLANASRSAIGGQAKPVRR